MKEYYNSYVLISMSTKIQWEVLPHLFLITRYSTRSVGSVQIISKSCEKPLPGASTHVFYHVGRQVAHATGHAPLVAASSGARSTRHC